MQCAMPSGYCEKRKEESEMAEKIRITTPFTEEASRKLRAGDSVLITGTIYSARDAAHKVMTEALARGEKLPIDWTNQMVYYLGPTPAKPGDPIGSCGPTTAGRMDSYVDQFQAAGGSMVMLAKGNRSKVVTESCDQHGGFYLGSIGGPAARLAQDCIKSVEVIEYPELGMEAVWKIEVEDFPAFIVVDDKGNDFFAEFMKPGGH